jgi:ATP adenylyltransferase
MEYILKARPVRMKCFLCANLREKADEANHILIRSSHSFSVLNKYPYVSGHAMVAPLRHIADIEKLREEEAADIFNLINRTVAAIRAEMSPQHTCIFT